MNPKPRQFSVEAVYLLAVFILIVMFGLYFGVYIGVDFDPEDNSMSLRNNAINPIVLLYLIATVAGVAGGWARSATAFCRAAAKYPDGDEYGRLMQYYNHCIDSADDGFNEPLMALRNTILVSAAEKYGQNFSKAWCPRRLWWRVFTPFFGAAVSLPAYCALASGVLGLELSEPNSVKSALVSGFIFGYLANNILDRVFGWFGKLTDGSVSRQLDRYIYAQTHERRRKASESDTENT